MTRDTDAVNKPVRAAQMPVTILVKKKRRVVKGAATTPVTTKKTKKKKAKKRAARVWMAPQDLAKQMEKRIARKKDEPPRDSRRLHFLRGWSHEHIEEVFPGSPGAGGSAGLRARRASIESQWAAIGSIAAKIGCTAETLRGWVRQAERDQGRRAGLTSDERERLKELERENRELKRANEILRKASAFFAQAELDRRPK